MKSKHNRYRESPWEPEIYTLYVALRVGLAIEYDYHISPYKDSVKVKFTPYMEVYGRLYSVGFDDT